MIESFLKKLPISFEEILIILIEPVVIYPEVIIVKGIWKNLDKKSVKKIFAFGIQNYQLSGTAISVLMICIGQGAERILLKVKELLVLI